MWRVYFQNKIIIIFFIPATTEGKHPVLKMTSKIPSIQTQEEVSRKLSQMIEKAVVSS